MTSVSHPYQVPRAGGLGSSVALALFMHGLLIVMLVLGLSWRSTRPDVIGAELWSTVPEFAAPTPPPQPVQPPEPEVVKQELPPPIEKPDIIVKIDDAHLPKPPPKIEIPVVKPKPVTPPKVEAPAPPKLSDLANLQAQASKEATGSSARTSSPSRDDSYLARLKAKIKSNTNYSPVGISGNPQVSLLIQQLPTGEVTSVTITRSSGIPAFDEAVRRGVLAASPLPRPGTGGIDPSMTLDFKLFEDR